MKDQEKLNKLLSEAEALARLMIDKGNEIKSYCRQAKAASAGEVSTSAKEHHLQMLAMEAVAKRQVRLQNKRKPNQ